MEGTRFADGVRQPCAGPQSRGGESPEGSEETAARWARAR
jgi:hypothetical protein